jgi:hypothetical protein
MRTWGDRHISHYSSCTPGIRATCSHRVHTRPVPEPAVLGRRAASSRTEPERSPATGVIACESTPADDRLGDWQASSARNPANQGLAVSVSMNVWKLKIRVEDTVTL